MLITERNQCFRSISTKDTDFVLVTIDVDFSTEFGLKITNRRTALTNDGRNSRRSNNHTASRLVQFIKNLLEFFRGDLNLIFVETNDFNNSITFVDFSVQEGVIVVVGSY